MDRVQLSGRHKHRGSFHLQLPSSKIRIKFKNAPHNVPTELVNYAEFLKYAIMRGDLASKSLFVIKNYYGPLDHYKPRQVIRNHSVDLSNLLQSVLGVHDFPLFQGPVVLPLDTNPR